MSPSLPVQGHYLQTGSGFLNNERNHTGLDSADELKQFIEYQASILIWRYVAPVILIVGTIGSILSLLILCGKSMRSQTTMFYLSTLAVADLFVLYAGLVRLWLENSENIYIRLTSRIACKLHNFFVYQSLDMSVWIIVIVSIDRCLYVSWPVVAKRWRTLYNARIIILILFCLCALINLHFFWTYDIAFSDGKHIYANGQKRCYADLSSQLIVRFVENVWPWIDFSIYFFIPFLIMSTSNAIIIKQLVRSENTMSMYQDVIRSRLPTRSNEENVDRLVGSSMANSYELGVLYDVDGNQSSQYNVDKGVQKTSTVDRGVDTQKGFQSDDKDIKARITSSGGDGLFLDLKQSLNHDVRNVKPLNTNTFGDSLAGVPFQWQCIGDWSCEVVGPHKQECHSLHRQVVACGVEEQSRPFSEMVNIEFTRSSLLQEHSMFDVGTGNINRPKTVVPKMTSQQEQLLSLDQLTGANVDASFIFENDVKNSAASPEMNMSKKKKYVQKLVEKTRILTNKVHPSSCSFNEISVDILPVLEPDTPHSLEANEACSRLWTIPNSERDILVHENKAGNKHKPYQLFDKANITCNNTDHNSLGSSTYVDSASPENEAVCKSRYLNRIVFDEVSTERTNLSIRSNIKRDVISASLVLSSGDSDLVNSVTSRRTTRSVSKTLLTVTLTFFIFNGPIVIFIIVHTYISTAPHGRGRATTFLIWSIVNILQYLNNALHFFLYCLTGPRFRQELTDMFKSWCCLLKKLKCFRRKS